MAAGQVVNDESLPPYWRSYYVREPVFGSQVRVATTGKRGQTPLVLVHGLGQNGLKDWLKVAGLLAKDHYVVALDLPGFGQSSLPTSARLSPENFAELIRWLIKDQELGRVHLAGHSMGGAVALYYAAIHPETLAELTLVDAAGILHRASFVKSMASVDRRNYGFLPEPLRQKAAKLFNFGNRLVEDINLLPDLSQPLQKNDLAWNHLLADQANTNAALSLINTDFSPVVAAVRTPTRIIWGRRDPVAPLRTGYMLRGLTAESELHIITDAEHVPIQTHAETVAGLMQQVIRPAQGLDRHAGMATGDLICRGRTGQRYSGVYRRIVVENCLDIHLEDIVAESIELSGSEVDIVRLKIKGGAAAMRMQRSTARLTDGELQGKVGVVMENSRLDLAGVRIKADETAIQIGQRSVVAASISAAETPSFSARLHGMVRAENVRGEALSQLRSDTAPIR